MSLLTLLCMFPLTAFSFINKAFLSYGAKINIGHRGFHVRREAFAFTWAPHVKFYDAGRFEQIKFPIYYRRIIIQKVYVVHLATVKMQDTYFIGNIWTDRREERDFQKFPTIQDYVRYRLKRDYDIDSEEEGVKKVFAELASSLIKCDYLKENCPEVLRDEIKAPRYKILYDENGRIIGRNDIGEII